MLEILIFTLESSRMKLSRNFLHENLVGNVLKAFIHKLNITKFRKFKLELKLKSYVFELSNVSKLIIRKSVKLFKY